MKIYISATYKDLREHRLAVASALRRMGHQVIAMEDYVSEAVRPLDRCLRDVAECDAYIGILAWRYGSLPTGTQPATLPPGTQFDKTSITEFEYQQAIATNKEPLMFLLDPDAEWPAQNFDAVTSKGNGGKDIAEFRRLVSEQHMSSFFRTPQDLAALVSPAVYRLEMKRQMGLESLQMHEISGIENGEMQTTNLGQIEQVITGPTEISALRIDIGLGNKWWSTRLYFLSYLAVRLTQIEVIVFVSAGNKFIGVANPTIVKERLEKFYPTLAGSDPQNSQQISQVDPKAKKRPPRPPPAAGGLSAEVTRRIEDWKTYMGSLSGGEESLKTFVTRRQLKEWLGPYLTTEAIDWEPSDLSAFQIQRLLDWPARFVPVVECANFARVVDKRALTEQVARIFIRDQVSRARSMVRY
jgi:hypothetical protein